MSDQEPVVIEASEPSSTTDSSSQSATIPETEVESAESVPVSDETIAAVITKEASSVTLTDQAPTESNTGVVDIDLCLLASVSPSLCFTHKHTRASADDVPYFLSCPDPVVHSVPAETETVPPSVELPAPVESEELSDTKEAPVDISNESSPAESTASLEPESTSSSEEPTAPKASDEPAGTRKLPIKNRKCTSNARLK